MYFVCTIFFFRVRFTPIVCPITPSLIPYFLVLFYIAMCSLVSVCILISVFDFVWKFILIFINYWMWIFCLRKLVNVLLFFLMFDVLMYWYKTWYSILLRLWWHWHNIWLFPRVDSLPLSVFVCLALLYPTFSDSVFSIFILIPSSVQYLFYLLCHSKLSYLCVCLSCQFKL